MRKLSYVLIFSVAVLPVWFLGDFQVFGVLFRKDSSIVPYITILLINPIFLAVINYIYLTNNSFYSIFKNVLASIIFMIISVFIHYAGWGLSTGKFFHPDWGTVYVLKYAFLFGCLLFLILLLGSVLFRSLRKKRRLQN